MGHSLAKPCLDVGLFADDGAVATFYGEALELPLVETLDLGPGYTELFHQVGGSLLKVNLCPPPLQPAPTNYEGLLVAVPGTEGRHSLADPAGTPVTVVRPGEAGVTDLGIVCAVADPDQQLRFLVELFGAERDEAGVTVGSTRVVLRERAAGPLPSPVWRRGLTYYSAFVDDVGAACRAAVSAGGEHGLRPLRLGDRCVFAWVRDPNGGWIELVQHSDWSPVLPKAERFEDHQEEVLLWRDTGKPW